jgi:hypothetical protein
MDVLAHICDGVQYQQSDAFAGLGGRSVRLKSNPRVQCHHSRRIHFGSAMWVLAHSMSVWSAVEVA